MRSALLLAALLAFAGTAAAQEPEPAAAADSAWQAGETERAERLYADILAADSAHYAALHRMALIRAWADEHEESLRLFDRLLRLYPEATDARIDRARVLAWQGNVDEAVDALGAVLDQDGTNVAAVEALAQFESWAGRYDEALRAYSRLAQLDPGLESVRYGRARVLGWASRFEAAGAVYDSILAERPDDVEALIGLARTLRWQGRDGEAVTVAERAVELDPTSDEAREELRRAAVAISPSAAPALAHEADSDGNRITTLSATARVRPMPALRIRMDAYTRGANERSAAELEHRAHGGTVTAAWEVGPGWSVTGGLGVSSNDVAPRPIPTYTVALSSPARSPIRSGITLRSQAFDATARMIERRVEMTDVAANIHAPIAGGIQLSAAAGGAWFLGRVSGERNRRWSGYLSLSRPIGSPFTLVATARGFGYQHDLQDGYFDPDFFGLAEVLGRLQLPAGPINLQIEAAPGLQKVRFDGDLQPVGRIGGTVTWPIGIARELAITGLFTNAGLSRLSAAEDAGYTYTALTARLAWSF